MNELLGHPANILTIGFGCALVTWLFWSMLTLVLGGDDEVGE